jgi:iduronate 2-sulfatase
MIVSASTLSAAVFVFFGLIRASSAQDESPGTAGSMEVAGRPVARILEQLGAALERGVAGERLAEYFSHFDRVDRDGDGRHSQTEYVDNAGYLTPQARRGIFNAADGDRDGFVTKAEYVLNRIITDEAKALVQSMDDDRDGLVRREEFIEHAAEKLSGAGPACQVFDALDTDGNGVIPIPEYLRVWGKWARAGRKPAEERIAARQSEPARAGVPARRFNVLFLAVDDLRPELGCYGHRLAKTPVIDRLAGDGVRFDRAYCQEAICSPSRASLMTGMRPDSLGVVDNVTYFRDTTPDVVTLPQHFRSHGYETVYVGKIYHGGMVDKEKSWSRAARFGKRYQPPAMRGYQLPKSREIIRRNTEQLTAKYGDVARRGLIQGPVTERADVPDNAYQDGITADAAVLTLRELKGKPFFLAAGFLKPHLPFIAPKKYWDLYDPAEIRLADNPFKPEGAPSIGLHASFELRTRHGVPKAGPIDDELARHLLHAYLACASYVDAQIGKILDELDRLGLRESTIIMLWGDHGWHSGEYGIWGKATNYEVGTRVPLIVCPPGGRAEPAASDALVELVDMYPTLCEMAGLPLPAHLEGRSFAPLIDDPDRPWKKAAFSQFPCPALREWAALPLSEGMRETFFGPLIDEVETQLARESPRYSRALYENHVMGYTMRTDRYRLVLWVDVRNPREKPIAAELYDHLADPRENVNLAGKPEYAQRVRELTARTWAGWREALPDRQTVLP